MGKGGVVRAEDHRQRAVSPRPAEFVETQPGWEVLGVIASPIEGGSGNHEFCSVQAMETEVAKSAKGEAEGPAGHGLGATASRRNSDTYGP